MTALSRFKKATKSASDLSDKLSQGSGRTNQDERFWIPKRNAEGLASHVIRFLPSSNPDVIMQKYSRHAFKGANGKWFINKCPKTLGRDEECPACDKFWDTWHAHGKDMNAVPKELRARGPEEHWVSNILVIKDSEEPENNGKVFLFDDKKSFYNEIKSALQPQFEEQVSFNPFDLWEGANYNFRIFLDGKIPSYKKSSWDVPSKLFDGDDGKLEGLINQLHDLEEFKYEAEIKAKAATYAADYAKVTGDNFVNESLAPQSNDLLAEKDATLDIPGAGDEASAEESGGDFDENKFAGLLD